MAESGYFSKPDVPLLPGVKWLRDNVAYALQVQQSWQMFVTDQQGTIYNGGWIAINGTLTDGREVDVLASLRSHALVPVDALNAPSEHLNHRLALHGTHRWLMVWSAMRTSSRHNNKLGRLLCDDWRDWHLPSSPLGLQTLTVTDMQTKSHGVDTEAAKCEYTLTPFHWFNYDCSKP